MRPCVTRLSGFVLARELSVFRSTFFLRVFSSSSVSGCGLNGGFADFVEERTFLGKDVGLTVLPRVSLNLFSGQRPSCGEQL